MRTPRCSTPRPTSAGSSTARRSCGRLPGEGRTDRSVRVDDCPHLGGCSIVLFRARVGYGLRQMVSSPPLLEMTRVSKTFRRGSQSVEVLRSVDLRVAAGRVRRPSWGRRDPVSRPSCSSRGGWDRPTSGEVKVAGSRLDTLSETALARLPAVGQWVCFSSFTTSSPHSRFTRNAALPLMLANVSREEGALPCRTAPGRPRPCRSDRSPSGGALRGGTAAGQHGQGRFSPGPHFSSPTSRPAISIRSPVRTSCTSFGACPVTTDRPC